MAPPLPAQSVTLQIWDTAGQERFQSLGVSFYRGANACVLVYDITDSKSFEDLEMWKDDFLRTAGIPKPEQFPLMVLGNKSDLESRRQVPTSRVTAWVKGLKQPNVPFYETSAKDSVNVEQAFIAVVRAALAQSADSE